MCGVKADSVLVGEGRDQLDGMWDRNKQEGSTMPHVYSDVTMKFSALCTDLNYNKKDALKESGRK